MAKRDRAMALKPRVQPRLRIKKGGTGIPARDAYYCGQECPHHLFIAGRNARTTFYCGQECPHHLLLRAGMPLPLYPSWTSHTAMR